MITSVSLTPWPGVGLNLLKVIVGNGLPVVGEIVPGPQSVGVQSITTDWVGARKSARAADPAHPSTIARVRHPRIPGLFLIAGSCTVRLRTGNDPSCPHLIG